MPPASPLTQSQQDMATMFLAASAAMGLAGELVAHAALGRVHLDAPVAEAVALYIEVLPSEKDVLEAMERLARTTGIHSPELEAMMARIRT